MRRPPTDGRATGMALTRFHFLMVCLRATDICASASVKFIRQLLLLAIRGGFVIFLVFGVESCSSSSRLIGLSCQERQIEIYVDNQYCGRDLIYYSAPRSQKYIEVSCRENGVEVYSRRINIENKDHKLIELQIPKIYKYSSNQY